MKKINKTIYECGFCSKEFVTEECCLEHERTQHKCPNCKYVYYGGCLNIGCKYSGIGCKYIPIKVD